MYRVIKFLLWCIYSELLLPRNQKVTYILRSGLVKHDIFCKQGLHTLSRLYKVRGMTFQVGIKTNYSTRVLVVRDFSQVEAASGKRTVGKKRELDGGSKWWRRWRKGSELLDVPVENQNPPGRPAELNYQENTVARGSRKDTASICHTLTAGKKVPAMREGWVAGWEKKINWKKGWARLNKEERKDVKRRSSHALLLNGGLYKSNYTTCLDLI